MKPQNLNMRNSRDARYDVLKPPRGKDKRIAAGKYNLPEGRIILDIFYSILNHVVREYGIAFADAVFSETKAAIGRAMIRCKEQQAVGIAMDQDLSDTVSFIADRIVLIEHGGKRFFHARHILARDRVCRIGQVDQA
jgi:hypothetical protein